jgi:hypothetical protein
MAGRSAWALDKYLDLEPAETLSGYGYGYDSVSRTFQLRQCVQFGNQRIDDGSGGASGDSFTFSSVSSNDQLADAMGLSVGAKFSASMGVASVATSGKVSFFQSTKTNFSTMTILASYSDVEPVKYIAGDINLKPEYLKMVGTASFRQNCGDYVIIGEQSGRWFYGTVQLTVKDTTTESRLATNGTLDGSYGTASVHVGENTVNKMKEASGSKDLEIRVTSSGTKTAALDVSSFLAQVKAFPGAKGTKQTYKLKAVPYEDIVANWPPSNPLAPLTAAQKLDAITSAAYGFEALIEDSDFVVQNPTLFALGTTTGKRDSRLGHMKARRGFYNAQLNDMRNSAKNCDVNWNGSPACEQLYEKWKNYNDFAVAEYEQFPVRYVSDCYSPRDVSSGGE